MNTEHTLQDLHDAFTELERRADLAEMDRRANLADPTDLPKPRPRIVRSTPVFAAVAAVAALIVGAVWVVPSDFAGTTAGTTIAIGPPTTHKELEDRFRTVLGDTATFKVTEKGTPKDAWANGPRWPDGLSIAGPLTANGVTGWFELQIFPFRPCPDEQNHLCPPGGIKTGTEATYTRHLEDNRVLVTAVSVIRLSDDSHVLLQLGVNSGDGSIDKPPAKPTPLGYDEVNKIVSSELWW
jgi:hypothetical protein